MINAHGHRAQRRAQARTQLLKLLGPCDVIGDYVNLIRHRAAHLAICAAHQSQPACCNTTR